MVLNDCCSCANPSEAPAMARQVTAKQAAASAHSFVTRSSSIRGVRRILLRGARNVTWFQCVDVNQASERARTMQEPGVSSPCMPRSAARGEKFAQQQGGLGLADAAINLRPVQAGGGREIAHAAFDCAPFGVGGAVVEQ